MNNFSKQILIGLAALAAVAYLGLQLSLNIGTMIDIDYATYATANDDITTDAYFFREETVLTSQYRGTNTYFYSDGEKVALGSDVVAVYASSSDASLQAKINSLNRKIKLLEMSSVTKTYSTSDISRDYLRRYTVDPQSGGRRLDLQRDARRDRSAHNAEPPPLRTRSHRQL